MGSSHSSHTSAVGQSSGEVSPKRNRTRNHRDQRPRAVVPTRYASTGAIGSSHVKPVTRQNEKQHQQQQQQHLQQAAFSAADVAALAPFYGLVPMNVAHIPPHLVPHQTQHPHSHPHQQQQHQQQQQQQLQYQQQQHEQHQASGVGQWQNVTAYCYAPNYGSPNQYVAVPSTGQSMGRPRSLGTSVPLMSPANVSPSYRPHVNDNSAQYYNAPSVGLIGSSSAVQCASQQHQQHHNHHNQQHQQQLVNSKSAINFKQMSTNVSTGNIATPYNYNDFYDAYKRERGQQQSKGALINEKSQPSGSLKRTKSASAAAIAQQATYEAMRTIDMYLVRQMARNLLDFDLEERIDAELRKRELATKRLASGQVSDELELLEIEKLMLTSDERMNLFALHLLRQRQANSAQNQSQLQLQAAAATARGESPATVGTSSPSPLHSPPVSNSQQSGTSFARVHLSDIRIPLMWRDVDHFKNRGAYKRYAVFCIVRCGSHIYDTPLMANVDRSCTDVTFDANELCSLMSGATIAAAGDNNINNQQQHQHRQRITQSGSCEFKFDRVAANEFAVHIHVFACAYMEEHSLLKVSLPQLGRPTARSLRRKLSASLSRALGRRLATSETFARELDAYDASMRRSYRFQLLASAQLRLDDIRHDQVRAYDLHLSSSSSSPASSSTPNSNRRSSGGSQATSQLESIENRLSDNQPKQPTLVYYGNSKQQTMGTQHLLPLFGHLCCRVRVEPDCVDRVHLSGYLRAAMVSSTPLINSPSSLTDHNSTSTTGQVQSNSPSSQVPQQVQSQTQTLGRRLTRSLQSADLYWAVLRNFAILLWPIDERLSPVLRLADHQSEGGDLHQQDAGNSNSKHNNNAKKQSMSAQESEKLMSMLDEPTLVVPVNKCTRIVRASNSTLTLDTQNGCYVISAHHGLADYAGACAQMATWLRQIETSISDSRCWSPVLDQILKPVTTTTSSNTDNSRSSPSTKLRSLSSANDQMLAANCTTDSARLSKSSVVPTNSEFLSPGATSAGRNLRNSSTTVMTNNNVAATTNQRRKHIRQANVMPTTVQQRHLSSSLSSTGNNNPCDTRQNFKIVSATITTTTPNNATTTTKTQSSQTARTKQRASSLASSSSSHSSISSSSTASSSSLTCRATQPSKLATVLNVQQSSNNVDTKQAPNHPRPSQIVSGRQLASSGDHRAAAKPINRRIDRSCNSATHDPTVTQL